LSELRENDNQLYEALTLLRGVNLLARTNSQAQTADSDKSSIEESAPSRENGDPLDPERATTESGNDNDNN